LHASSALALSFKVDFDFSWLNTKKLDEDSKVWTCLRWRLEWKECKVRPNTVRRRWEKSLEEDYSWRAQEQVEARR